ncbi:Ig-like domain-containing protein [Myxococcaceae bacterium GXIMD 01537]
MMTSWRSGAGRSLLAGWCILASAGCQKGADAPEGEAARAVQRLRAQMIQSEGGGARAVLPPAGPLRIERGQDGLTTVPEKAPRADSPPAARVVLPDGAERSFQVRDTHSGLALEVALQGASPARAQVVDGYVVYPDAYTDGGDVVHRLVPEGTEDYLTFERAPAVPEVRYALRLGDGVAGLRLVADTLEVLDGSGAPRLRMAPPYLVGADGRVTRASVSVPDCAVDTRPTAPWGRPVTEPGSRRCQVRVGWGAGAVAYPAVLDPLWSTTGSLARARRSYTLTTLQDGRVLAAGGESETRASCLYSSELYDPATGTWAATGYLGTDRRWHTAVLLGTGKVLVMGGLSTYVGISNSLSSAELYDPATGAWSSAGAMRSTRYAHVASRLSDGRVLVYGGVGDRQMVDVFDPGTGTWSATGSLLYPRVGPGEVALPGGKLLVFGGTSSSSSQTPHPAELYDAASGTWTQGGPFAQGLEPTAGLLLADGRVLAVGGAASATYLYEPAMGTWSSAGTRRWSRDRPQLRPLPDGRVLLLGDGGTPTEMFDPATGTWAPGPLVQVPRWEHSTAALADGRVLTAAGSAGSESYSPPLASAEVLRFDLSDTTPPTVSLTSPTEGAALEGTVTVTADASDDLGVRRVEFFDGETLISFDTSAPYSVTWSTTYFGGPRVLTARAYDGAGNVTTSAPVSVLLTNDVTGPTVTVTSPTDGSVLSPGPLLLSADAVDDKTGVSRVEFWESSTYLSSDTTVPYQASWDTTSLPGGPYTLSAVSYDVRGNKGVGSVQFTLSRPGTASYDATLQVPACAVPGAVCDSGTYLRGRVAPTRELHAPNTLQGSCADGANTLQSDHALDRIRLSTVDGGPLRVGKTVRVEVTLRAASISGKALDLYQTADARTPVWTPIATLTPSTTGTSVQTLSTTYVLPKGGLQAVRGRYRFNGSSAPCGKDGYDVDDHDDLAFAVEDLPPSVSLSGPGAGATVGGTATLSATASDDIGVSRVEFYAGATLVGSDTTEPYSVAWDTTGFASGNQTLTARAYDTGGNSTLSAAVQVRVDNVAPTVALTTPVEGAPVSGTLSLTATASDDVGISRVEFHADGVLVGSDTSAPYAVTWNTAGLAHGDHVLTARAYDTLGNSAQSAPVRVWVDTVAPTVALTEPVAGSLLAGTASAIATVGDDVGLSRVEFYAGAVLLGTRTSAPFALTWDTSSLADGSYALTARAHDTAGNVTQSAPVQVSVNNRPPAVALTTPSASAFVGGTITLSASASDGMGIARVEFHADGVLVGSDSTAPYSVTWDTRGFSNAEHTLTVRAYDTGGLDAWSAPVRVRVDNVPPTATLTAPAAGAWLSGPVTLTAVAQDDVGVAGVEFYLDGYPLGSDTTAPYTLTWDTTYYLTGSRTLEARAYDAAGNMGPSTPVQVWIDRQPPTVAITSPSSGGWVWGTRTVTATASDDTGVTRVEFYAGPMLLGTATSAPYSVAWDTTGFAEGAVTLTARAYDGKGNSTVSAAVQAIVENLPPQVALIWPVPGASVNGLITVAAEVDGEGVGIQRVDFFIDGYLLGYDGSAPYMMNWDARVYPDGIYTLTVRAVDDAGRSAESAPVQVRVDRHPPTVALTAPAGGSQWAGPLTLSASASDDVGVTQVDFYAGGQWVGRATREPYAVEWDPTGYPSGGYALTAIASDAAGNTAQSAYVQVWVDSLPPSVAIASPPAGSVVKGQVVLAANASDNRGVTRVDFYLGTTLLGSALSEPFLLNWDTTAWGDGSYTLSARAFDALGNMGESMQSPVHISNTPPTVTLTAPAPGATVGGVLTLSASASDTLGIQGVEFYAGSTWVGTDTSAPYSVSWDTRKLANGSYTLTAWAYNLAGTAALSEPVQVTVNNVAPAVAYDTTLGAPRCSLAAAACDSDTLLTGRGPLGPEPNQPNTVGACVDASSGSYHADESVDRLRVSSVDGLSIAAGKTVRIDTTVWAYSGYSSDYLDLYYAADASAPSWVLLGTLQATSAGAHVLTQTFVPASATPRAVVRAVFRYQGSAAPAGSCPSGSYTDVDDLVFVVQ